MGTAVHEALEKWERSDRNLPVEGAQSYFRQAYTREVNALLEVTPNTRYWFGSGPYEAEEDIPRRKALGIEHVAKAIAWYDKHPTQKPWKHPDGRMGVELPFKIQLGTVPVRGYIDWLGQLGPACVLGPRDNKTGRNPGKVLQLKIYDIALDDHFAWRKEPRPAGAGKGDFFMTKTGKPTVYQDLTQITRDEVVTRFETVDAQIQSGAFPAKPDEDTCRFCSVRSSCSFRA
jgi:putative RecB family exonuclease